MNGVPAGTARPSAREWGKRRPASTLAAEGGAENKRLRRSGAFGSSLAVRQAHGAAANYIFFFFFDIFLDIFLAFIFDIFGAV